MLAGASLDADALSTKCSVNSSNHSGRSCGLPSAGSMSSALFVFTGFSVKSCNKSLRAQLCALRQRVDAGLGVKSALVKSCRTDVENVLS